MKYVKIVGVLVMTFLILILYMCVGNCYKQISQYRNNETALKHELDSVKERSVVYELSVRQMAYINDSISRKMNDVINELGIAKRKVSQIQYIESVTEVHDSIIFRDTLFLKSVDIDTLLTDGRWYDIGIHMKYPDTLRLNPKFYDEYFVVMNMEKEIVGTPSKVFFVRWFQKKQKVMVATVKNSNPNCIVNNSRFVKVIK